MLLTRLPRRSWRLPCAGVILALASALLSSCSVRYDDAYDKTGLRDVPPDEAEVSPAPYRDSGRVNVPVLFGIRRDDSLERERRRRADAYAAPNPQTAPSYKEIREARAAAYAEADLRSRGAPLYVQPNGGASRPENVKFVEAEGALGIRLAASPCLNSVGGVPNALTLVVYHLSDLTALNTLASTEDGLGRLLEGEMFDASVKSARVIDVQPGLQGKLALPRAEGGRYVAVVAGYNRPRRETSLHVRSYPLGQYSERGDTMISHNVTMYAPLPMNMCIELGERAMRVTDTDKVYDNYRASTRLMRRQAYHFPADSVLPNRSR